MPLIWWRNQIIDLTDCFLLILFDFFLCPLYTYKEQIQVRCYFERVHCIMKHIMFSCPTFSDVKINWGVQVVPPWPFHCKVPNQPFTQWFWQPPVIVARYIILLEVAKWWFLYFYKFFLAFITWNSTKKNFPLITIWLHEDVFIQQKWDKCWIPPNF